MSTVLVFAALPAAVIGVVAALVLASGAKGRQSRRYRPGRPFDFQPIWFLAAPDRIAPALTGANGHRALEAGDTASDRVLSGPTGGASDRW